MRFPRRIFRPERKNNYEAEGNLSNEASRNLYFNLLLNGRMTKSPETDRTCSKRRRERTHRTLVGKSEGKTPLGRLTHSLKDNVKMDLKQREYG
jgi:hypothetical protein